jgi:opacity protein-like surface antigen
MKKLMMIAVMAIFAMTASAQNTNREVGAFTLQPKVGLTIGSFSGEYVTVGGKVENKKRVGFTAGLEGEIYATNWLGIALGLNYAQQGWKFNDVKCKYDYLNVPLVADFYVARGLALKTGVQLGFLMNAKWDDLDVKDDCNKTNFSIPIGISYEFSNVVLDLRYNVALSKVNKNATDNYKYRSDLVQITIGYKFEL